MKVIKLRYLTSDATDISKIKQNNILSRKNWFCLYTNSNLVNPHQGNVIQFFPVNSLCVYKLSDVLSDVLWG